MNAKVVIYLLISACVLPGCASFKAKLQEAKEAEYAKLDPDKAEREKFFAECEARYAEYEKQRKEFDEYIKQFSKDCAEYNAWYDSLSSYHQAYITRELEEMQIRYNQIHGFNPDGSSRYDSLGIFWDDRFRLMNHYKPIWDNLR